MPTVGAVDIAGHVDFRGCGKFEMYSNVAPEGCLLDGKRLEFRHQATSGRITLDIPRSARLQGSLQVVF